MQDITITRISALSHVTPFYSWMDDVLTLKLINGQMQVDSKDRYYKKAVYARSSDGGAVFLSGLTEDVVLEAKKRSIGVNLVEGRNIDPSVYVVNRDLITQSFRYKQEEVIETILSNDKGVIRCLTGFGKSFIIKTLCRILPNARIVITTAASDVVDGLYNDVSSAIGKNEVGKLSAGTPTSEENKRVVVSTIRSLRRAPLEKCDILFFDEVHNCGDNKVAEELTARVGHAKMYGFTATLARGDGALGVIRGLFGKVIADIDYQEGVEHEMVTPIKALIVPCPSSSRTSSVTGIQAIDERNAYWCNDVRNRLIADIASNIPDDVQTLIMVKTFEHAICLHKQPALSEWPIMHFGKVDPPHQELVAWTLETMPKHVIHVRTKANNTAHVLTPHYGDDKYFPGFKDQAGKYIPFATLAKSYEMLNEDGEYEACGSTVTVAAKVHDVEVAPFALTPKQRRQMRSDFESGKIMKMIATMTVKEGCNFNRLQYLIRGDGAVSEPFCVQIPGRLARLCPEIDKQFAVLIDFDDGWNKWVSGRSSARKKFYKQKGWL